MAMNGRRIASLLRVAQRLHLGRAACSTAQSHSNSFGIVLDIDGVLFRGRDVLPRVPDAFKLLTDNGRFTIPTVFLTNGSNSLRAAKAQRLSQHLGLEIRANQVVMAHSPLRMFTQFHDKHVLVVGQGPVNQIAKNLGFNNVTTLDELRNLFPHLDCVDFSRRKFDELNWRPPDNFTPIEAIVLLGEPLHWESALQLLLDVLITNGDPGGLQYKRGRYIYPNLPLLACNVDMVWMAEKGVNLPRIGHGSFLTCLEAMYYKLMACELKYTAVLGKPTEVSYLHATHCLQDMANDLGHNPPKTVYVIGDNPLSDVLGSNLYNRYLQHGGKGSPPAPVPLRPLYDSPQTLNIAEMERRQDADVLPSSGTSSGIGNVAGATPPLLAASQSTSPGPLTSVTSQRGFSDLAQARFDHVNLDVLEDGSTAPHRTRENVEECLSVLVETGVYREGCHLNGTVLPINKLILELSVKEREMLEKPDFVEKDLFSAVRMILNRERWR